MNRSNLINKRLAILLWESKDDALRFEGQVIEENGQLFLADDKNGHVPIKNDWLNKVKAVEGPARFMFKTADLVVSIRQDELPDDAKIKFWILKHHDSE